MTVVCTVMVQWGGFLVVLVSLGVWVVFCCVACRRVWLMCESGVLSWALVSGVLRMFCISLVIFFAGPSPIPATIGLMILVVYGGMEFAGLGLCWLWMEGAGSSVIHGGATGGWVCVIDLTRLAYGLGLLWGVRR